MTRRTWPQFATGGYGLANVARFCGFEFQHHDALEDARAAGRILVRALLETGVSIEDWLRQVASRISPTDTYRRQGDGDGALTGETVVFTGALEISRTEAANRAAAAGAHVQPGVTKHTTMLVVGDQDIAKLNGAEKSSKHRKAEQLRDGGAAISILGETDFMALSAISE